MKIDLNMTGVELLLPDFGLLRASLLGLQSSSPTALADRAPARPQVRRSAIVDLLAPPYRGPADLSGAASFDPAIARFDRAEER